VKSLEEYLTARASRPHICFERSVMETGKRSQVDTALQELEGVVVSLAEAVDKLESVLLPVLRPVEEKPCTVGEKEKVVPLAGRISEVAWHLGGVRGVILSCIDRLEL